MNAVSYSTNRSLIKIGGWSALASGGFYILLTVYIFGVMPQFGFTTDMFDDHSLLHPWVATQPRLYQISWLFYFFAQLCLLPVPMTLAHFFNTNKDDRSSALVKLGPLFGMVAIPLAMLSAVFFYASSPLTAQAYVEMSGVPESQNQILILSGILTDLAKEIRLFSEILLGVWLISTGYLFRAVRQNQSLSWLSYGIGAWTLFVVGYKFFDPYAPLEDALGIFLGLSYIAIGIQQLRFVRNRSGYPPTVPSIQTDEFILDS